MTRMVPRPDWTPEELLQTLSLVAQAEVQYREAMVREAEFGSDGVDWGPVQSLLAQREKAVFALFRPAEEPGIITATADHARPLEPIPWDDDYPRETPAPVAPPPAGEPAKEGTAWAPVLVEPRTPNTESVLIHHAHRGQACVACELAALRSELSASQREVERLRAQGADLEFDVGRLLMERYARRPVPSGENRSVDAGSPPAGGTAG